VGLLDDELSTALELLDELLLTCVLELFAALDSLAGELDESEPPPQADRINARARL